MLKSETSQPFSYFSPMDAAVLRRRTWSRPGLDPSVHPLRGGLFAEMRASFWVSSWTVLSWLLCQYWDGIVRPNRDFSWPRRDTLQTFSSSPLQITVLYFLQCFPLLWPDCGHSLLCSVLNFGVTTVLHWLSIGTLRAIYMMFWILYVTFKTTLARLSNSVVVQAFYQLLMSSFFNTFIWSHSAS